MWRACANGGAVSWPRSTSETSIEAKTSKRTLQYESITLRRVRSAARQSKELKTEGLKSDQSGISLLHISVRSGRRMFAYLLRYILYERSLLFPQKQCMISAYVTGARIGLSWLEEARANSRNEMASSSKCYQLVRQSLLATGERRRTICESINRSTEEWTAARRPVSDGANA